MLFYWQYSGRNMQGAGMEILVNMSHIRESVYLFHAHNAVSCQAPRSIKHTRIVCSMLQGNPCIFMQCVKTICIPANTTQFGSNGANVRHIQIGKNLERKQTWFVYCCLILFSEMFFRVIQILFNYQQFTFSLLTSERYQIKCIYM